MAPIGPAALFTAWALHDVEEGYAFPATCDRIADLTGVEYAREETTLAGSRSFSRQQWPRT